MAGATRVHAVAKASRFGSVDEAVRCVDHLAKAAGVAECIGITDRIPFKDLGSIDILTNSGHLRPITGALIERLPKIGVIALMYEAWEFRPDDLDLAACFQHGIPVVGVNERHPSLDVFSYLGELCAHQMHAAGVCISNNKIALLCDNEFGDPIKAKLVGLGGTVSVIPSVTSLSRSKWDTVVIALKPTTAPRIGRMEIEPGMRIGMVADFVSGHSDRARDRRAAARIFSAHKKRGRNIMFGQDFEKSRGRFAGAVVEAEEGREH